MNDHTPHPLATPHKRARRAWQPFLRTLIAGAVFGAVMAVASVSIAASGFPDFEAWWNTNKPDTRWADRFDSWYAVNRPIEEPPPPPTESQTFTAPWRATAMWSKPLPPDPEVLPDSATRVQQWIASTVSAPPNAGVVFHNYGVAAVRACTGCGYTVGRNPNRTSYDLTQLNSAGPVPVPSNAIASLGTDNHLSVWDAATHRAWDMGGFAWVNGQPVASYGHTYTTDGYNGIAAANVVGATAANFPLLGGLIRPEEIAAGVINHRLTFNSPCRRSEHWYPATHHGGSGACGITEGSLTRFNATAAEIDAYPIPTWQKIVLKAWAKYGAYHRDGGGASVFANVYGEDDINRPGTWAALGLGDTYYRFDVGDIPWAAKLQVLAPTVANN